MSLTEVELLSHKLDQLHDVVLRMEVAHRRDHDALQSILEERTFLKRKLVGLSFSLIGAAILALGGLVRRFLKW